MFSRIGREIQRWIDRLPWRRKPSKPAPPPTPSEFPEGLVWLDINISDWPVTTTLDARIEGNNLVLDNDKATTWPEFAEARGGGAINAMAWVLVEVDGTWYAVTWEFLRTGQHVKRAEWLRGTDGHIHRAPLSTWEPVSGERYGFMVSTGTGRAGGRTLDERSNVSWMVWP